MEALAERSWQIYNHSNGARNLGDPANARERAR